MPQLIRAAEHRRTETPNAVMTTLASPTLGPTSGLSMWEVTMTAGASGPSHVFDSEQIWTVREGELAVTVDGESEVLGAGDTVVMPEGSARQVSARSDVRLVVFGYGAAAARVPGESEWRGTPPWIG